MNLKVAVYGEFKLHEDFIPGVSAFIKRETKFPYHLISGKYYVEITKEDELECVVNDMFGSYRLYIKDNKILTEFPENYVDDDEPQLALLGQKGYCQGEKSSDKNICKVPPCSAYRDNEFLDQLPEIEDMGSEDFLKSMIRMISDIKSNKIGVAFSGGTDSFLLVKLIIHCNKTPVLYHMVNDLMDKANKEDLEKSQELARKLNLDIEIITITSEDRTEYLSASKSCWRNDQTNAFLNIRCFLKKINELNTVTFLVTGQNADTFINHGITRKMNILDIYQLICHKYIFKKLFEINKISLLKRLFLLPVYIVLVDRSLKKSWKKIPTSKLDFIIASVSETFYLPTLNGHKYKNYFDAHNLVYDKWYFLNKLNNHIGGNHSIAWSDDNEFTYLKTVMPYSTASYLNFCNSEFKTLNNIFFPKRKLQKVLRLIDR